MSLFKLVTKLKPQGDQQGAIDALTRGFLSGKRFKTLLGVTGSGKTFTMANVIRNIDRPTLIISHNKTLAAQLYAEFKELFPKNAVEYFVSYYDYYQPEAYVPHTDTYIEKDASINEEIDKLRLAATSSIIGRRDVIVVASVSCIYGLGSPQDYAALLLFLKRGQKADRDGMAQRLVDIHYNRNEIDFGRGTFRIKGDTIDVFPAYGERAVRVELDDDTVSRISEFDPVSGKRISDLESTAVYPAKHFVTTKDKINRALVSIKEELKGRLIQLNEEGKLLEAQRLESRARYDMEMLDELGYCSGVENYSRHLAGRPAGSRPYCLLDYFTDDFLTIVDESHVTIPQVRGMYAGDRARKETLIEHGFRLPSALDNRPLMFDEFETVTKQMLFASATPSPYELEKDNDPAEQIIRPTGLVDPEIIVKPSEGEVDDLIGQIRERAAKKERVLVTTLTKRMSEDLTRYLEDVGIKVRYMHSEVETLERVRILRDLRSGEFDCLVGINLLREGLDLPEVSLVAILDADKEGFLRSQTALMQTAGRAARNVNSQVIMYADTVTDSMRRMIEECGRRRKIQTEYNREHNITPTTVKKAIMEGVEAYAKAKRMVAGISGESDDEYEAHTVLSELEREMELAARNLQFERAAAIRDQIVKLRKEYGREDTEGISVE